MKAILFVRRQFEAESSRIALEVARTWTPIYEQRGNLFHGHFSSPHKGSLRNPVRLCAPVL
jgi:hypothetical protein